jgi:hypothetical protein
MVQVMMVGIYVMWGWLSGKTPSAGSFSFFGGKIREEILAHSYLHVVS